ncbi:unnamed protein product, partial [Chrysoparadoxa australica]
MRVAPETKCSVEAFLVISRKDSGDPEEGEEDEGVDVTFCLPCREYKIINERDATATCPTCGDSSSYQASDTSFRDGVQFTSQYLYKRRQVPNNHFRDHLKRIQGKESTNIKPEVLEAISAELMKRIHQDTPEGIARELKRFTTDDIRAILKRLKLSKLYNHCTRIHHLTTGNAPPSLSESQEEELCYMFKLIQEPWERHCPKTRSNMLSYSYLIHKFSQLLGYSELAKHFKLLKSREKASPGRGVAEDMQGSKLQVREV